MFKVYTDEVAHIKRYSLGAWGKNISYIKYDGSKIESFECTKEFLLSDKFSIK